MTIGNTPLDGTSDSEITQQNFRDIWNRIQKAEYNVNRYKNHIIGGDFTTNPWQRGTSFVTPATGTYTADRWRHDYVTTATTTILRNASAPAIANTNGYYTQDSLQVLVTAADAAIAAGDYFTISQRIEGLSAAHFGFGQSVGAKYVCVSFWFRSSKIGCYTVAIRNSAQNRSYIAPFYVLAASTWEYKSINIPVDNSGTWLYTNGVGLEVSWCLAGGGTYQGTDNVWQAGNLFASTSQVNALDTLNATINIALVSVTEAYDPVEFEPRSYAEELALCQRYYQANTSLQFRAYTADGFIGSGWAFPVTMRATPTPTLINNGNNNLGAAVGGFIGGSAWGYGYQWTTGVGTWYAYGASATFDAEL